MSLSRRKSSVLYCVNFQVDYHYGTHKCEGGEVFLNKSTTRPLPQNDALLSMRGRQSLCQGFGGHLHVPFGLGQLCGDDFPTSEESVVETQMYKWADEEYLALQA